MNDRLGEERLNNNGSLMKIVKYKNYNDIDIYFPDFNWTKYKCNYSNFINGKVRCPYEPRYHGKGYLGEGEYKIKDNGKTTKAYRTWYHMLERCYSERSLNTNPSYEGCYVCDEWLNFQNFAEWFENNYYEVEGEDMDIDKDVMCKNNNIYGPDTCMFLPHKLNILFTKSTAIRGELPIGVTYGKQKGTFQARCNDGYNTRLSCGTFKTVEEAFEAYKKMKEKIILEVVEEYKESIPYYIYEAICNYEISIND